MTMPTRSGRLRDLTTETVWGVRPSSLRSISELESSVGPAPLVTVKRIPGCKTVVCAQPVIAKTNQAAKSTRSHLTDSLGCDMYPPSPEASKSDPYCESGGWKLAITLPSKLGRFRAVFRCIECGKAR